MMIIMIKKSATSSDMVKENTKPTPKINPIEPHNTNLEM